MATALQILSDIGAGTIAQLRNIGESAQDIIEIALTDRPDPLKPATPFTESKTAITAVGLTSLLNPVFGAGLGGRLGAAAIAEPSTVAGIKPSQLPFLQNILAQFVAPTSVPIPTEAKMADDGFFDFSLSDILPSSQTFSDILKFTAQTGIVQAFLPQPSSSPFPGAAPVGPAVRTMAAVPAIGGMAGALGLRQVVRDILFKIARARGLFSLPTLNSIMAFVRKASPIIGQAAVAAGLAITAEELATLIFAHATKKRRRMNPGNVKALRRSMRRLESFHRLCVRADTLRGRGRGRSSKKCATGTQFVRQG